MKATRREALMGALMAPVLPGIPNWRGGAGSLVVHDDDLAAGRMLAARADQALAITGDRVRFAKGLFHRRPAMVIGISRPADALLIEEVGREAGYRKVDEGTDSLRALIDAAGDRGLVLGWVLAKGTLRSL